MDSGKLLSLMMRKKYILISYFFFFAFLSFLFLEFTPKTYLVSANYVQNLYTPSSNVICSGSRDKGLCLSIENIKPVLFDLNYKWKRDQRENKLYIYTKNPDSLKSYDSQFKQITTSLNSYFQEISNRIIEKNSITGKENNYIDMANDILYKISVLKVNSIDFVDISIKTTSPKPLFALILFVVLSFLVSFLHLIVCYEKENRNNL